MDREHEPKRMCHRHASAGQTSTLRARVGQRVRGVSEADSVPGSGSAMPRVKAAAPPLLRYGRFGRAEIRALGYLTQV